MDGETPQQVRRLVEWQPPLGVLSLYLKFDPGDRSGAWRTELRNGLAEVLEGDRGRDHETLVALRATGERISERFANHDADLPRGEVGFVEVSAKPGREEWRSSAVAPDVSLPVAFGERPLVAPLMSMLARGAPRGVALLSGERVRLLQWAPRRLDELHAWELSVFSLDWRERKAATVADPSRGQAVSTSGHDRFDARLRENRHRFLGECGKLARLVAPVRAWGELVLFGSAEERREFERGFGTGEGIELSCGADADLVSEPADRVEQAIEAAAARLDAARELHLVERALGESQGGVRGALGPDEVQAALAESRVESLVIDAARAAECEPMVKTALESGASVATILGEAADRLAPCGGSAAVLRY